MKVALLHTRLSGYLAACLRQFRQQTGAEILMYVWPNQPDAPFDSSQFTDIGQIHNRYESTQADILKHIHDFAPQTVMVSGWKDKGYVAICRQLKAHNIPIISGCDTQWGGSLRQHVASYLAPFYVQKFIDVLWVTGERQRYLANALGYRGDRCWDGYYACDWSAFAQSAPTSNTSSPHFLYVGRYASEKGLDTLAEAYQRYCKDVSAPWDLVCVGAGPLRDVLLDAGAKDCGFVQPDQLPSLMHQASAFILPSKFEPWGVVAHEAATSSLPLILSDACGSAVHLLRPHFNGFQFAAGSIPELTNALKSMHRLRPEQRSHYGQASHQLSQQYTPERWAQTFIQGLASLQQ